ncbi:MAG: hypothetical protein WCD87_14035, partial [Pseudolabrys sp.]
PKHPNLNSSIYSRSFSSWGAEYKPSRGRPISDLMIMPSYLDVALCQYGHWSLGFIVDLGCCRAALLLGQFEPSFGDLEQFSLFFFASSFLRGSQSFLAKATILFGLADHRHRRRNISEE